MPRFLTRLAVAPHLPIGQPREAPIGGIVFRGATLTSKGGHCFAPTGMTMEQHGVQHESTSEPVATLDIDVVNRRTAELIARNSWSREQLIQFRMSSFANC